MSAESARSVSRAKGVDRVRALQRVLYRCAKQDRDRRFHALYDKVARSDVLWRAWGEVRANRGAAGVDGVTIDDVVACGVGVFLDELAQKLRAGSYRPRPLRRVHIPKPGRPNQFRPLGIPCLADRVVMAAARIVLEPIFGKRRTTGMREGNERVLHRRPSESRWPRPCVGDPRGRSEALDRGARRPAMEPRNGS
jgi:retron-type reverse transcriptase